MPERKKGKHLSLEDRYEIQKGLREHRNFKEIAAIIGCSADTVSKEIRKHRYQQPHKSNGYLSTRLTPNNCKHRYTCRHRDVCNKPPRHKCRIPCRECLQCNKRCPYFVYEPCQIENKPPYVCNNCSHSRNCLFDKYLYNAEYAHREYREELSVSRQGIDMTKEELAELDALVSPLIRKGQPVKHIMRNHADEIGICERSLYNYVEQGYLDARKTDLRRAVRYKPRKANAENGSKRALTKKKLGRRYKDFLKFVEEHPGQRIVEMDTVEGIKGGKVLQTFLWRENGLMIAFLKDSKGMSGMVESLDLLEEKLGLETFQELFPLILTDNGLEFADPEMFEASLKEGRFRSSIYYCEPRQCQQKGSLEKNHEYIRYIIPKGRSFDELTQEKVDLMMSHINSTVRPRFAKTPYEMAEETFGEEILKKLGLMKIDPDEVDLTPSLIK